MRERYSEITKEVLLYFALAGALAIAATSPYFALHLARKIAKDKRFLHKHIEAWKLARAIRNFQRNKLIILKETGEGKMLVQVTEKGKRKVKEIQLENFHIAKPAIWDKKWRVIVFDIPEEVWRKGRDALRDKLQKLGFYCMQKSVWVCPWPCETEVLFLCELFQITPYVNILLTERIWNDITLKKYFHLL